MPNVTPLHSTETVVGGLRNALWIAELGVDAIHHIDHEQDAANHFEDIARLLKNVLEGLSEPNLPAMQAGEILIRELNGTVESQRNLRDTIAGILNAQLTGNVPKTWSPE